MRAMMVVAGALLLSGCFAEVVTTTAITGGLQSQQMKAMKGQIQGAAGTTGRINIERAIQTYRAEKGVNPPSLEALVPGYLPALPTKPDGSAYDYDAVSGRLLDGAAAGVSGPTAADYTLMQEISVAVYNYGQATGYYPGSLDDLVPGYLSAYPRTSGGAPFHYDPQTGYVAYPEAAAPPAATPRVPVSGGSGLSPMGEAVTGMGIQNQLNSMGTSGASAAGGYGRRSVNSTAGSYGERQNQVVDQLGL